MATRHLFNIVAALEGNQSPNFSMRETSAGLSATLTVGNCGPWTGNSSSKKGARGEASKEALPELEVLLKKQDHTKLEKLKRKDEEAREREGNRTCCKRKTKCEERCRKRERDVLWFNPHFNINVKMNVATKFLKMIDKHLALPKGSLLHRYFYRSTVKVSYNTTKNMKAHIDKHNTIAKLPASLALLFLKPSGVARNNSLCRYLLWFQFVPVC